MKILALAIFIFFIGCTGGPRSATMCLSEQTGNWVKCPKGIEPGTYIQTKTKTK